VSAQEHDHRRIEDYCRMLQRGIPSESTALAHTSTKLRWTLTRRSGTALSGMGTWGRGSGRWTMSDVEESVVDEALERLKGRTMV
jgi:hypothetical protein